MQQSDLTVPLSMARLWQPPVRETNVRILQHAGLALNPELAYHRSALLAASLDTLTLAYRTMVCRSQRLCVIQSVYQLPARS